MTTTTKTKSTFSQTTTAGGWYQCTPALESQVIEFADARTVALWVRLRYRYWMTECEPLTWLDITNQRRKMAGLNPADALTDDEVHALLSPAFGFIEADHGWAIPALQAARGDLMDSAQRRREAASRAGQASANKRTGQQPAQSAPEPLADF